MPNNRGIAIPRTGTVETNDATLRRQLEDLERQHVQRSMINRSRTVLGREATSGIVGLAVHGHDAYAGGTEQMVQRYQSSLDHPMVREPLEEYTRRQIADTGRHVRAVVEQTAQDVLNELERPYRLEPRKRGFWDRLLGER